MSWPQIKKNNKNKTKLSFWNVIFSYSTQQQWTFSQSDCDVWQKVDFIWQLAITCSVVGPRSFKALPKAKFASKKNHGHCLIHYSFLNPSKTITSEKYAQQISEMHQKLQHLQPALVNRKGPILLHNNNQLHVTQSTNASKAEQTGLLSWLIGHIHLTPHQPSITSSRILTTFCSENASTTSRREKIFSKTS